MITCPQNTHFRYKCKQRWERLQSSVQQSYCSAWFIISSDPTVWYLFSTYNFTGFTSTQVHSPYLPSLIFLSAFLLSGFFPTPSFAFCQTLFSSLSLNSSLPLCLLQSLLIDSSLAFPCLALVTEILLFTPSQEAPATSSPLTTPVSRWHSVILFFSSQHAPEM